jgi:hypothetical protein
MDNRPCFFALCASIFVLISCAIQYDNIVDNSDEVPEFVLANAKISRYEKSQLRVSVSAALVEQYKMQSLYYARDVSCLIFSQDGELQTEVSFGFAAADTGRELYTLFDAITVNNYAEDTMVNAESLLWSGKTGLLASGKTDEVTITRVTLTPPSSEQQEAQTEGDLELRVLAGEPEPAPALEETQESSSFVFSGHGFFADAFRRTYQFTGVSGTIESGE